MCDETLRRWRRERPPLKLVYLKIAYLQIKVDESLWQYQQVVHEGQRYYLTRLGFGLNCAPRVMTKILTAVLERDNRVRDGTSSYIDDILVNENVVSADDVVEHLRRHGLEAKSPVRLDGSRVLGLQLRVEDGEQWFGRGNELPTVAEPK